MANIIAQIIQVGLDLSAAFKDAINQSLQNLAQKDFDNYNELKGFIDNLDDTGTNLQTRIDNMVVSTNTAIGIFDVEGTGNDTITGTYGGIAAYFIGLKVNLKIAEANTGSVTFNLNNLGASLIKYISSAGVKADVPTNYFNPNSVIQIQYDGTDWVLISNDAERIIRVESKANNPLNLINDNSISASKFKIVTDADRIKLQNLSDEVLQAMAGTTPVNSTPAANSVTTEKVANEAVTFDKVQKLTFSHFRVNKNKLSQSLNISNLALLTKADSNITLTIQDADDDFLRRGILKVVDAVYPASRAATNGIYIINQIDIATYGFTAGQQITMGFWIKEITVPSSFKLAYGFWDASNAYLGTTEVANSAGVGNLGFVSAKLTIPANAKNMAFILRNPTGNASEMEIKFGGWFALSGDADYKIAYQDSDFPGYISNNSISTSHIQDNAVKTSQIQDAAITDAKAATPVKEKLKRAYYEIAGNISKWSVDGSNNATVSFPALKIYMGANSGVLHTINSVTNYNLPNTSGLYIDMATINPRMSYQALTVQYTSNIASDTANGVTGFYDDGKCLLIGNWYGIPVGRLAHNPDFSVAASFNSFLSYYRALQGVFKYNNGSVNFNPATNTLSWCEMIFICQTGANRIKLAAGSYTFTKPYEVCYLDLNDVVSGGTTPNTAVKGGQYYDATDPDLYKGLSNQLPLYAFYDSSYHFPIGSFPKPSGSTSTIKYNPTDIIITKTVDNIVFYIKGSNPNSARYIKHNLHHTVSPFDGIGTTNINADLWRLHEAYEVERTDDFSFTDLHSGAPIVNNGEWECALHEVNAVDFIGGFHGDEILSNVILLIDGIQKDLTSTENLVGERIKFIQQSTLYQCNTQTPVATHLKVYDIDYSRIKIYQEVVWNAVLELDRPYLCMLPIKRVLDDNTQITDRAFTNADYVIDDVSVEGFTGGVNTKVHGITSANIWGTTSGISAEVEVQPGTTLNGSQMQISNDVTYNKFYFNFAAGANGITSYNTSNNEKWVNTTIYKLTTRN